MTKRFNNILNSSLPAVGLARGKNCRYRSDSMASTPKQNISNQAGHSYAKVARVRYITGARATLFDCRHTNIIVNHLSGFVPFAGQCHARAFGVKKRELFRPGRVTTGSVSVRAKALFLHGLSFNRVEKVQRLCPSDAEFCRVPVWGHSLALPAILPGVSPSRLPFLLGVLSSAMVLCSTKKKDRLTIDTWRVLGQSVLGYLLRHVPQRMNPL